VKEIGMNMQQLGARLVTVGACLLTAWAAAQGGAPSRAGMPGDSAAPPVPGTPRDTAASPTAPPSVDCQRDGAPTDVLCGSLQSSGTFAPAASSPASAPRRKPLTPRSPESAQ